jgi:predicted nucleic acid-binding protein
LTDSARRPIPLVFVDTNVLYPVRLADLVLSCAVDGLFDLCVSDDLLDEIERVLTASKGLRTEKVRTFRSNVEAVATVRVDRDQYREIRDQLVGPDADDLWHLAAAMSAEADMILTSNTPDFDRATVPPTMSRIDVVTPDRFFEQLIDEGLGDDIRATIGRMSDRLRRPPRTPEGIIDGLEHIGLTKTTARLRNR